MLLIELFVLNPRYSFKVFRQKTAVHNGPSWMVTAWTDFTTAAQCPRLEWNNMALFTVTGMRWYSSEFYEAPVKRARPSTQEVDDGSYVIPPGRSQTEDWSQTYTTTRIKRSLQHFNRLPALSDADQLRNIITAAKDADFFSQRLFLMAGH